VLLNRAPTLHRLSIQAFKPVLIEGKAIQISPLICTPFNADFDGDQMAVHLPLSLQSQMEARTMMLSSLNILSPAHGGPLDTPVQDMVIGIYYLTLAKNSKPAINRIFDDPNIVELLYEKNKLDLHDKIKYSFRGEIIETTVGRVIFNTKFREGVFDGDDDYPFINEVVPKKKLEQIVSEFYDRYGLVKTDKLLDNLKDIGFKFATYSGISIGLDDIKIPKERENVIKEAQKAVDHVEEQYEDGLLSESQRYETVVDIWKNTSERIQQLVFNNFDQFDTVYMMATSGARGSVSQITQMAGVRGLMAGPTGKIIEFPILSNLREGLTVLEYFPFYSRSKKGSGRYCLKNCRFWIFDKTSC